MAHQQRSLWREIVRNKTVYLFISPFYMLFLVFGLFPILFSLYLAVHKWDGIGEMRFVGLDNFVHLLANGEFWHAVANTFAIWGLANIPLIGIALVLAYWINYATVRSKPVYMTAYFLPYVTSAVAVAMIFSSMFTTRYGIANYVLGLLGLGPVAWLNSPLTVMLVIAFMYLFQNLGYTIVLFIAGLQRISRDLYDAAQVDGAGMAQLFFRITVPLLRPIILFMVLMSTIGGLQLFTEPQVLSGNSGSALPGSLTIVFYLYQQGFRYSDFGYAAAVSWMLFLFIAAFSLTNWRAVNNMFDGKGRRQ